MKAGGGQHFEQSYKAQAAVDEAMLIVGERVSTAANNKRELVPTAAAISPAVVPAVKTIPVHSGFYSEAAVQAVEQKPAGTASGLTVRAAVEKFRITKRWPTCCRNRSRRRPAWARQRRK